MGVPVRLTRDEKRAATKDALLESAAAVFAAKGYGATSVEDIAETAGFSRGAFYSNFESKEDLFLELVDIKTNEHLIAIAHAFTKGDTAAERIHNGGMFVAALVTEEPEWCKLFTDLWMESVRNERVRKRFADQYATWRASIGMMIEAQHQELGVHVSIDTDELASAIVALFDGYMLQKLIEPDRFAPDYFARMLLHLLRQEDNDV